jgi:ABC-type phosphate transport system permease subunit
MIRFLLRFIGLLLLALAFIFVIYDGMKSIADGGLSLTKFGQIWTEVHASSLQALQAVIERYAGADLWQLIVASILAQPVAAVFGVIGVVLIMFGRKKKPLIGYARD